ncbi:MAG: hypothetical protein JJ863_28965 [Deltaproteobacteria bacterium]|nr:hypothetical protein [Deltaproteobacteria bacterium]
MSDAQRELSRAITRLLLDEPFFAHLLGGLVRRVSDERHGAGVGVRDGRLELRVNPRFFCDELRTAGERAAVVKHEALHLLFGHAVRGRRRGADPKLWDVATDLVVNQYVSPPPPGAITLRAFPDLGLQPHRSADHYYAALERLAEDSDAGDGAGGAVAAPRSAKALAALDRWHSDHEGWASPAAGAVERAGRALADARIAEAVARSGDRGVGALPGPLRRLVAASLERRRPRVDWRRVVRLFATSSNRTRIGSTLRRPSRRYGTFPGLRVERRVRLAAAVDTSGSVSTEALQSLFAEVHGLWRRGVEVHVFECDAAVQRRYEYRGQLPDRVAGRGGTAFDPVFRALRADRLERWDGCLYLTDGRADAPTVKPPCPLLWVLPAGGQRGPHLRFGRAVTIAK